MKANLKSFLKEIEITMACVAYAEAGEPCPIHNELKENKKIAQCTMSVLDTMTCGAFAEAGVPCPICEGA